MKTVEIGLSLGGNLGDRLAVLRDARSEIEALPGVVPVAASVLYETEPVGVREEYAAMAYLNAVLIVKNSLSLFEFAQACHGIEERLGRVRGADRYAPRTCDIDLIYAGEDRVECEGLALPHPRWHERRFVVQPLADVRPELVLPGQSRTVRDILASLPERPGAKRFTELW